MAWICASGMGTLLRKPSRAPLMVLSGELRVAGDNEQAGHLMKLSCLSEHDILHASRVAA